MMKWHDDMAVVSHIDPMGLKFFDLMPKGGVVLEEAKRKKLKVGFNNGFFSYDKHKGFAPEGRIVCDGKLVNNRPFETEWAYTFFIFKNGSLRIDKFNLISVKVISNVHLAIEAGPRLVYEGNIVEGLSPRVKASRLALGWDENGLLMIAAIRDKITLHEFAKRLKDAGFLYALNMDGGGSTSLYYNDGADKIELFGIPTFAYDVIKYEHGEKGRKVPHMLGIE